MKNRTGLQNMIAQGRVSPAVAGDPPECCDKAGAERIKAKIVSYWKSRGYDVDVTLKQRGFVPVMRSGRHDIRSNMVNGLPRDYGKRD